MPLLVPACTLQITLAPNLQIIPVCFEKLFWVRSCTYIEAFSTHKLGFFQGYWLVPLLTWYYLQLLLRMRPCNYSWLTKFFGSDLAKFLHLDPNIKIFWFWPVKLSSTWPEKIFQVTLLTHCKLFFMSRCPTYCT